MEIELSRLAGSDEAVVGSLRLDDRRIVGRGGSLADQGVRFPEPFEIDAVARRPDDEIFVTGRIVGRVQLQCSRCLGPVDHPVDLEFSARFVPASADPATGGNEDDEEGIELEGEDLDVSELPAGATMLPVEDMVLEQVLLDLPFRALCREDCKGLCPRCGADRNREDCGCGDEDAVDPRLAPLLELRRKLKDE